MRVGWVVLAGFLLGVGIGQAGGEEPVATASQAEQDDLYARAVVLLAAGQHEAADKLVQELLVVAPPDAPAVIKLQRAVQLARLEASQSPEGGYQARLQSLVLEEVNFREAAPVDIIDWLRAVSARASDNQQPLNIVWMVPPATELPLITLQLRQIPLLDVVRYVTQLAQLEYRVESHALVIRLPQPTTLPTASP